MRTNGAKIHCRARDICFRQGQKSARRADALSLTLHLAEKKPDARARGLESMLHAGEVARKLELAERTRVYVCVLKSCRG